MLGHVSTGEALTVSLRSLAARVAEHLYNVAVPVLARIQVRAHAAVIRPVDILRKMRRGTVSYREKRSVGPLRGVEIGAASVGRLGVTMAPRWARQGEPSATAANMPGAAWPGAGAGAR